jgi:uncharacterized protein
MQTPNNQPVVKNNQEAHRYEIHLNGEVAILTYQRSGNRIIFVHTGVPPALEGHGLASQLAHTALEDARTQNLTIVPLCPFVESYLQRHPEYLSLLDPAADESLREDS